MAGQLNGFEILSPKYLPGDYSSRGWPCITRISRVRTLQSQRGRLPRSGAIRRTYRFKEQRCHVVVKPLAQ